MCLAIKCITVCSIGPRHLHYTDVVLLISCLIWPWGLKSLSWPRSYPAVPQTPIVGVYRCLSGNSKNPRWTPNLSLSRDVRSTSRQFCRIIADEPRWTPTIPDKLWSIAIYDDQDRFRPDILGFWPWWTTINTDKHRRSRFSGTINYDKHR